MKIVKYLIAALLIISITKKVHVTPDELEYYDAASKTAKMSNGDTYVGIVEYNRSVTPPNIANPSLKLFTQISTQNYATPTKPILGGLSPLTSLYGIPAVGAQFYIKSNKKTIGTYWPINKVAQLNDGQTFVAIIEEQVGNYKNHHYYQRGPIWTQFDATELSKMYNIDNSDVNFKSRVKNIGTITKHNKQTFKLYGVLLNPPSDQPDQSNLHNSRLMDSPLMIEKEVIVPGMDSFTKKMRRQVTLAYQDLQDARKEHSTTNNFSNAAAMYAIPG